MYCTICGEKGEHSNADGEYYYRCTDKKCKGRKGVAVTRVKQEKKEGVISDVSHA
jgi:hypothetical protein